VNEEKPTDGVGVAQPTCAFIHEAYEWELEPQHSAKDDSLPSEPPPFFPSFFGEPTIHDFACVSSSTDAPIVDHSQESPDVSPSFDNGEEKLFIEDPLDPSPVFSGNTEDEFVHFSSTPLFDSSDHEDVEEFIDFSDHGCHYPFSSNFNHDHESIVVDFLKPPVYDDLLDDEVETPKVVEALQPKLMVMSCPRSLGVSLTSDHEIVQSPKAPHHSSILLKIHLTHRSHFLHLNYTIPLLMLWRSLTLQALVRNASCLCFIRLLPCHSQECAYASNLNVVSHSTTTSPRTVHHAHALAYVLWAL